MSKNPMNQRGASSGSWTTTPLIAAKEQWTGSAAKAIDRATRFFASQRPNTLALMRRLSENKNDAAQPTGHAVSNFSSSK